MTEYTFNLAFYTTKWFLVYSLILFLTGITFACTMLAFVAACAGHKKS